MQVDFQEYNPLDLLG